MSTEIHCCVTNKCTGPIYCNWYLDCKFCKNPVFIECMRQRDEQVKTVLLAWGLARINSKGEYLLLEEPSSVAKFMKCFQQESAFSITCEVCSDKFKKFMDAKQNVEPQLEQRKVLHEIKNTEQLMNANTITTAPESNITKQISIQSSDCLDLFVPNFPAKTECDAITALIMSRSTLQADDFEISKMAGPKVNLKYRKFMSFKIKVPDKTTYDIIMDENVWIPFSKPVPFNANARNDFRLRMQRKEPVPQEPSTSKVQPESNSQQTQRKIEKQKKNEPEVQSKDILASIRLLLAEKQPQNKNGNRKKAHKSSQPHAGRDQRSAKQSNDPSNSVNHNSRRGGNRRNDRFGPHQYSRGSDFQGRRAHGSNFHEERRYNHRPLNHNLKSVLSLLARVLDQY